MKSSKKPKKPSNDSKVPETHSHDISHRLEHAEILLAHYQGQSATARKEAQAAAVVEDSADADPCATLRLVKLTKQIIVLTNEIALLQSMLELMDACDELMACEMANMSGDTDGMPDDPPTPEAS